MYKVRKWNERSQYTFISRTCDIIPNTTSIHLSPSVAYKHQPKTTSIHLSSNVVYKQQPNTCNTTSIILSPSVFYKHQHKTTIHLSSKVVYKHQRNTTSIQLSSSVGINISAMRPAFILVQV